MLTELTVKEFTDKVIGKDPVPGGGSVSALSGALAAALTAMVANLTAGRKKYMEVDGLMQNLAAQLSQTAQELLADVDRDSEAYNQVFDAFKLPKETDEEKAARSEAIQQATHHAAEVPMEVARRVCHILPWIVEVGQKGNSNAITDACVAMMCARTAIRGALLNVKINLGSLKDEEYVNGMRHLAALLENQAATAEKELLDYAQDKYGL